MKIDIMTLFPAMVDTVLSESIIGRARNNGLIDISCTDIRDFTSDKHRHADDYPYGGGMGMVMLAEPLYLCHRHLCGDNHVHTILMSAQGNVFTQETAKRLISLNHMILVCGHYEGVDERFIEECVDEEISIGDFVLTGGEIAACAVADAICRMVPGVLSDSVCFEDESHFNGLLEYPQYTRPEEWRGRRVPDVLLSGHHANIEKWRREQSLERTKERRPDMYDKYVKNK